MTNYRKMSVSALLDVLVEHALGRGVLDDNTPLWQELARRTKRDPDTGNRLSEEAPSDQPATKQSPRQELSALVARLEILDPEDDDYELIREGVRIVWQTPPDDAWWSSEEGKQYIANYRETVDRWAEQRAGEG